MNIWLETMAIALVSYFLLFQIAKVYVTVLLYLGTRTTGIVKGISGFLVYIAFAVFLVSPLYFMIHNAKMYPLQELEWSYLIFSSICFLASTIAAFKYVFKVKLSELQAHGFYISKQ